MTIASRLHGNSPEIIITGGTGFIGTYLTDLLIAKGYGVSHLTRGASRSGKVRSYNWDPERGIIERGALSGKNIIIHLAGTNLGSGRLTNSRKASIISSRADSARLLHSTVTASGLKPDVFISASGTGYYGSFTSESILTEESPPGDDFLAATCREWEAAAGLFAADGVRTAVIRTAPVLAADGGGLSPLLRPARYGLIIRAGSGKQYMPWIHISDLCGIYLKAAGDDNISGAYNAVSPGFTSHEGFMGTLAEVTGKPVFLPAVPEIAMRLLLGEMSDIILKGSRVSSEKITRAGYIFKYPALADALRDITCRSR